MECSLLSLSVQTQWQNTSGEGMPSHRLIGAACTGLRWGMALHWLLIACSASGWCRSIPKTGGKGQHAPSKASHELLEERAHTVVPAGLRAAACHVAGGLCHRRWAGMAGIGPQPFPAGDVYRQRLTPCRARGGPRQSADGGLCVTVRAAV
jgi:hypothetical protein